MRNDWKEIRLGDFVTLQRGHDLPETQRKPGVIPILGSFGITGMHDTAVAKGPGVTVGRSGASFGVVSYSPVDFWPLNTALYVTDFHGNDARFAYYLLKSIDFTRYNSGSAQPSLNRNFIHPIEIRVPDVVEQLEIVALLGALDDKIGLNWRMNETLEAIARATFGLQMEGVDTSQEGKFSRIATISRDSIDPSASPTEVFDHYSIPAYDEKRLPVIERGANIKSNKFIVHANSVLLSKLNPRIPRIWMPNVGVERRSICSTEFLVLRPTEISSREFIYGFCSSPEFQDRFATMVTGTSGSHQRVQPDYIEQMEIRLRPVHLVRKYSETVAPLHERYANNLSEARTLAVLRDALLPNLISGKLRIRAKEGF
jgi:type I restriction enzyme S subunit